MSVTLSPELRGMLPAAKTTGDRHRGRAPGRGPRRLGDTTEFTGR